IELFLEHLACCATAKGLFIDKEEAAKVEPPGQVCRTYEWYRRHCQAFAKSIGRKLLIEDLKPNHVTPVYERHFDWSPTTKHGFCRAVRRAFRWAQDEGIIQQTPLKKVAKPEPEDRDIIVGADEYQMILDVVKEPNFRELIEIAWESGARPRECRIVE